jgi:TolA-binding protein
VIAVLLMARSGWGTDRLTLQPRDTLSPLSFTCEIVDYTLEAIVARPGVSPDVRRFPTDELLRVETVQTEAHREALAAFLRGELAEAEAGFRQALEDEPRAWMRREIRGWLIRCASRRRDRVTAASRFLEVVSEEPAAREFPLIPLVWGPALVDEAMRTAARSWLTDSREFARLIGASWLLLDPAFADLSRTELGRLSRSSPLRLAAQARAQLWRLRVAAADLSDNELSDWEHRIEQMPGEGRAGPYFVLGRALQRRSDYDRAVAAFLWLPTVCPEDEELTAEALVAAARASRSAARREDAERILAEVVQDYSWTAAAAEAEALRDELRTELLVTP